MNPTLSIIIVNYNGEKYLNNCFSSIHKVLENQSFEVVMVDNQSNDNSVCFTKEHFPWVKIIEATTNLGFGKGNNLGVQHANGEFVLLLNNDTILIDNPLELIPEFQKNSSIGAIGIKMLNSNQEYIYSFGNFPNAENLFIMKRLQKMKDKELITGSFKKNSYRVDWLGGSFVLMQKSFYKYIGGFDEDYFLYVEDVDFGKKILNGGKESWFYPNQSYIHFVGFNTNKNMLLVKGYDLFLQKHSKGINFLFLRFILFINSLVKIIKLKK